MTDSLTYADAGVDIDKANELVKRIKLIAKETVRPGVMGEIGGFGGLFSLNTDHMTEPVLVSSTDGVGTKLNIAFMTGKHDTIGIDLVAMCINDILVQGAKPLFFLDYLSTGKLNLDLAEDIIRGIGEGCKQAQCALIGGETAEMPGFYNENEYDMAGFTVGIVDNSKIIDGSDIRVGHKLIGLASSGLHSNGYSLVRKICFDILKLDTDSYVPELGKALGEELLCPTIIYSETLQGIVKDLPIHGLVHVTGGGIPDNVIRVIPETCGIVLKKDSWEIPPVFPFLQEAGHVSDTEMLKTFNNGIGMIAIVPDTSSQEIMERLSAMDKRAYLLGEVVKRDTSQDQVRWEK